MLRTVEATIDSRGNVHLLEPVKLPSLKHALVTILDEEYNGLSETALLSQAALLKDWGSPEEDTAWSFLQQA